MPGRLFELSSCCAMSTSTVSKNAGTTARAAPACRRAATGARPPGASRRRTTTNRDGVAVAEHADAAGAADERGRDHVVEELELLALRRSRVLPLCLLASSVGVATPPHDAPWRRGQLALQLGDARDVIVEALLVRGREPACCRCAGACSSRARGRRSARAAPARSSGGTKILLNSVERARRSRARCRSCSLGAAGSE